MTAAKRADIIGLGWCESSLWGSAYGALEAGDICHITGEGEEGDTHMLVVRKEPKRALLLLFENEDQCAAALNRLQSSGRLSVGTNVPGPRLAS